MKFASTGLRAAYRRALSRRACSGTKDRSGESGLTLLEVLVALTILAIAMTSLFEANSTSLRATGITEDTALARLIAQAKFAETIGSWSGRPQGRQGSEGRFNWRVDVSPETAPWSALKSEPAWRLYRVNVAVEWPGNRSVVLSTLKLGVAQ